MYEHVIDKIEDHEGACRCHCKVINDGKVSASSGCSEDAAAIGVLPNDWIPKRGGPIITNFLKEKENNHNKALQDFNSESNAINLDVNGKIRELAERLVDHIQHNQRDIDEVVATCNNVPNTALSRDARIAALNRVHDVINKRLEDIADFRENALKLEKERKLRLGDMLRKQFQQAIQVGHRPPKILVEEFDDRIFDYNQTMYSNIRAYDELEVELRTEADGNFATTRSVLNQMCIGSGVQYRVNSAHYPTERKLSIKRTMSAGQPKPESSIDKLIGYTQEEIDQCITQLLKAYKENVLCALNGFRDKLKILQEDLTCSEFIENKDQNRNNVNDLEATMSTTFRRISSTIKKLTFSGDLNLKTIAKNDLINMEQSLITLSDCLRDTFSTLHDAGHLWDNHILRAAKAQKLTITAVEDLITNNDMIQQCNEVAFNNELEHMIAAPDEKMLKAAYNIVQNMLEVTEEMYKQHNEAEINRLEQYMELPPVMAKVLLAEFKSFLGKNQRTPILTLSCYGIEDKAEYDLIPRATVQTEIQQVALNNWRNGFLESLENSVSQIPEELVNQAQLWVKERSKALQSRHGMKQMAHALRLERIQAMYEKRRNELYTHEARLRSHVEAVNELVNKTPTKISEHFNLDNPELYPIHQWLKSIDDNLQVLLSTPNVNREVRLLKMKSYALRLSKHRALFEQSVDRIEQEAIQSVIPDLQNARISNVRYLSSVRLMHEGGSYSHAETSTLTTALSKASDLIEHCHNTIQDMVNRQRAQLLAIADTILLPVQKVVMAFVAKKPQTHETFEKKASAKEVKKK